jgi:hypothetical protein
MEDKVTPEVGRCDLLRTKLQQAAKENPTRAKVLEAIKRVMEENRVVLQRLADS